MRSYYIIYKILTVLILFLLAYDIVYKMQWLLPSPPYVVKVHDVDSYYSARTIALIISGIVTSELIIIFLLIFDWIRKTKELGFGPYKYVLYAFISHLALVLVIKMDTTLLLPYLGLEFLGTEFSWAQHLLFDSLLLILAYIAADVRNTVAWERFCDSLEGTPGYISRKSRNCDQ